MDAGARALESGLRHLVRQDRALYELGVRAFVSWVKAYSKHEVSYIFRMADVPLDAVACEYALLRFPKMPEVAQWRDSHRASPLFSEADVNVRSARCHVTDAQLRDYAYADRQREKQRLAALETAESEVGKASARPRPRKVEAWSEQKRRKEARDVRREKKERKHRWLREHEADKTEDEEEDDWAAEERAAKRVRKNALAEDTFQTEFYDGL